MTTIQPAESIKTRSKNRQKPRFTLPKRRRGRPAQPLPDVITVDHPIHRHIFAKRLSIETVMTWTGRSRSTVARWAKSGRCPDLAVERLLQLYAFGMPPIPPELYRHPCCEQWALMSFGFHYDRPIWRKTDKPNQRFQWVIWSGKHGFNVEQVRGTIWLNAYATDLQDNAKRAADRAAVAEQKLTKLTHQVGASLWR